MTQLIPRARRLADRFHARSGGHEEVELAKSLFRMAGLEISCRWERASDGESLRLIVRHDSDEFVVSIPTEGRLFPAEELVALVNDRLVARGDPRRLAACVEITKEGEDVEAFVFADSDEFGCLALAGVEVLEADPT